LAGSKLRKGNNLRKAFRSSDTCFLGNGKPGWETADQLTHVGKVNGMNLAQDAQKLPLVEAEHSSQASPVASDEI
jgi:hypothetical protein